MEVYDYIGDLLGSSSRRPDFWSREDRLRVLTGVEPTEDDEARFEALLQNGILYRGDRCLMIRINPGLSTGLNLKSGAYALGAKTFDDITLFLARKHDGWEDPTGSSLREET